MFQLHERTAKRMLLGAVLLLSFAPTVWITTAAVWRSTAWHQQAVTEAFGRALGLDCHAESVSHPRPGATCLEAVQFTDTATGEVLLSAERLVIHHSQADTEGGLLRIDASGVVLSAESLDRTWDVLVDVTAGRRGNIPGNVHIHCGSLRVQGKRDSAEGLSSCVFENVSGTIERQGQDAVADLALAGREGTWRLRCETSVEDGTLQRRFGTATEEAATIDNSLLAALWPEWGKVANEGDFSGMLWIVETTPGRYSGELSGVFDDIALPQWCTGHTDDRSQQRSPHSNMDAGENRALGGATVRVARLRWIDGRLHSGEISIQAGPGTLDRSFVQRCRRILGCPAAPPLTANVGPTPLPFQALEMSISLQQDGLRIVGAREQGAADVVLLGQSGPLLGVPVKQPLSWEAILAVVVGEDSTSVPFAPEHFWLWSFLPLDAQTAPETARVGTPASDNQR